VLESTFTSTFRVMVPPIFPFDRFATGSRLARIDMPTLVIHGADDTVIGVEHGRRLHRAARSPRPPLWVAGAGHDDVALVGGKRYFAALRAFAASLPPLGERPAGAGCPAP
jgi:pimeloyl-ACP methyl ester carboxylesterase